MNAPFSFTGRRALVTGANRGIGLAIAQGLAEGGAEVILVGRDPEGTRKAAQRLVVRGHKASAEIADLRDPRSVSALAERVGDRLDILINNAGAIDTPGPFWEIDAETWKAVIETNVSGHFWMMKAFAAALMRSPAGRIVNMSSGMGQFDGGAEPGHAAYRTSKAALNMLTQTASADFAGTPVLVNAMCPGWVRTRMGGEGAPRSVAEGADTAFYLAALPAGGPTGGFFRDRQPLPW